MYIYISYVYIYHIYICISYIHIIYICISYIYIIYIYYTVYIPIYGGEITMAVKTSTSFSICMSCLALRIFFTENTTNTMIS